MSQSTQCHKTPILLKHKNAQFHQNAKWQNHEKVKITNDKNVNFYIKKPNT